MFVKGNLIRRGMELIVSNHNSRTQQEIHSVYSFTDALCVFGAWMVQLKRLPDQ